MKQIICSLLLFIAFCRANEHPEVETSLGKIRGLVRQSFGGRKYAVFEGIPFAKPPIGDLRFEDPQPIDGWKGTWDATVSHTCIQAARIMVETTMGEEDCLYLNVYVPLERLHEGENLDVIAYVHGGAFMIGSGSSYVSPDLLMDKDIVFVSFNYRLGILGFLSTGDGTVSGNLGLKDQVLALKWIQRHVKSFGGNPDSVTLAGLSAGAASVHLHYFSPLSKGLFHRAFSESGVALNPWVLQERPGEKTKKLASLVGCIEDKMKDIVECLKKRPATLLLSKLPEFYGYGGYPFSPFAPVVESVNEPNRFLPKHPMKSYVDKDLIDVPWLVSTTADEGLFPFYWLASEIDDLDEKWPDIAAYALDYNYTMAKSQWAKIGNKIKEYYLGPGVKISRDNLRQFAKVFSDRLFVNGAEDAARRQSKVNKSPVYYFVFSHESEPLNMFNIPGAGHGLSRYYMYGASDDKFTEEDKKLLPLMVNMLTAFVKTGKPEFPGVQWDPVRSSDITYVNIKGPTDIKLETQDELSPREFWSSLDILENEKVVLVKDEL
ncbi:venom carboxylesterase-6-like isoform X2 [Aethina tumida]|uniref:venom carboxylesterase-6-like isoform X2 n=1 Tax=Aethina tumida TaxID=116153 RepID=UPI00214920B9|nr:venom carboxylesterase-6-like isoform X2 [Aethina tumida]